MCSACLHVRLRGGLAPGGGGLTSPSGAPVAPRAPFSSDGFSTPTDLKDWLLLFSSEWHAHRETVTVGPRPVEHAAAL